MEEPDVMDGNTIPETANITYNNINITIADNRTTRQINDEMSQAFRATHDTEINNLCLETISEETNMLDGNYNQDTAVNIADNNHGHLDDETVTIAIDQDMARVVDGIIGDRFLSLLE
jgi:hypothetical protein